MITIQMMKRQFYEDEKMYDNFKKNIFGDYKSIHMYLLYFYLLTFNQSPVSPLRVTIPENCPAACK